MCLHHHIPNQSRDHPRQYCLPLDSTFAHGSIHAGIRQAIQPSPLCIIGKVSVFFLKHFHEWQNSAIMNFKQNIICNFVRE